MNYFLGIMLAVFTAIMLYYTIKILIQVYKSQKVGYVVRYDKVQVLTTSKMVAKDEKGKDVFSTSIWIFVDRTLALEAFMREQRIMGNDGKVELNAISVIL